MVGEAHHRTARPATIRFFHTGGVNERSSMPPASHKNLCVHQPVVGLRADHRLLSFTPPAYANARTAARTGTSGLVSAQIRSAPTLVYSSNVTNRRRAVVLFERDVASEAREKRVPRALLLRLRRRLEQQVAALEGVDMWIAASDGATLHLRGQSFTQVVEAHSLSDQLSVTSSTLELLGYAGVVLLAADIALSPATLPRALAALGSDANRVVVGESGDGGFYLFGYTGTLPFDWKSVPLRGADTAATLKRLNIVAGRIVVAEQSVDDLDSRESLQSFLADLRRRGLELLARQISGDLQRSSSDRDEIWSPFCFGPATRLRAPPSR